MYKLYKLYKLVKFAVKSKNVWLAHWRFFLESHSRVEHSYKYQQFISNSV